jgi:uncharacterized protein YidB (DUF937 family)
MSTDLLGAGSEERTMGLFDSLKGAMGQIEAEAIPTLLPMILAKTNLGDLQGLVSQLQQGGLGTQVQSWLGSGQNLPVTAQQLEAALGSDQVKELAQHFGVDPTAALNLLAQHLPNVLQQASQSGAVQPAS